MRQQLASLGWIVFYFCRTGLAGPPLDPGGERQVFIDGRFLESSQRVTLQVHAPRKTGEISVGQEHPWESRRVGPYGTVMKLDGIYHMWYEALSNFDRDEQGHQYLKAARKQERLAPLPLLRPLFRRGPLGKTDAGGGRAPGQPPEQHRRWTWGWRHQQTGLWHGFSGPHRLSRSSGFACS